MSVCLTIISKLLNINILKKYNLFIYASILFFIYSVSVFGQVTQDWVSRYNGPGSDMDWAFSVTVDGSGNVYVTGVSRSGTSSENGDYATIKYNTAGVQQWVARYNGPGNNTDWARSIKVDGSGNVYVTGYSYGSGTNKDYATIKYNSAGVEQWVQRYNGPANDLDEAYSLAVDGSGNVYVTGYSWGSGTEWDCVTIKYNSAGSQQWVQGYNGPANGGDYAYSIAVDASGDVYVAGGSIGSGTQEDYAIIKYNSAGVEEWVQRYNGPANGRDEAYSIAVDGSGNVYVTGYSIGNGILEDYATIKYNSAGVEEWVQRYNGPGNELDWAYSIAVDASSNVYVTGHSLGNGSNDDYATIKYNSAGAEEWVQRYNGPGNSIDRAYSIAVDASGNVYVTGRSFGSGTGRDYATIKYNSAGVEEWIERYNGPGGSYDDEAFSIAVDGSGNVYVTGGSVGNIITIDYATIKYSQPIAIQPISTEIPKDFSLSQNYPNPFNPGTKIRFALPKSSFVKLVIYDVIGSEVATIVNEQLNAGTYEADWSADKFTSGVYFYRLTTKSYSQTMKMILIK